MSSGNQDFSGLPQSSGTGVNVIPSSVPPSPPPPLNDKDQTTFVSTFTAFVVPAVTPSPPNPVKPSIYISSATQCLSWGPGRTLY